MAIFVLISPVRLDALEKGFVSGSHLFILNVLHLLGTLQLSTLRENVCAEIRSRGREKEGGGVESGVRIFERRKLGSSTHVIGMCRSIDGRKGRENKS